MGKALISSSNITILLVGTAADKKRRVKIEDAINYAKKHNFIG